MGQGVGFEVDEGLIPAMKEYLTRLSSDFLTFNEGKEGEETWVAEIYPVVGVIGRMRGEAKKQVWFCGSPDDHYTRLLLAWALYHRCKVLSRDIVSIAHFHVTEKTELTLERGFESDLIRPNVHSARRDGIRGGRSMVIVEVEQGVRLYLELRWSRWSCVKRKLFVALNWILGRLGEPKKSQPQTLREAFKDFDGK